MTLGSPGATRIFPTIALVISHVIDNGMSIQEAINAPRWFTMASGNIEVEGKLPYSTIAGLRNLGYTVTVRPDMDLFFGGVHAVLFDHRAGRLYGGADPRRDGVAKGF
jgi:gamma-glutamyltranspeptidase/glutathione hydrolase